MPKQKPRSAMACVLGAFALVFGLASTPTAMAACRVTDFTTTPLSSLSELQRLSFTGQMTRTEFDRLKAAAPGSANYYPIIANSTSVVDARRDAQTRIAALHMDNSADYSRFWASDYLTDAQLRGFVACSSRRRPGLVFAGRPDGPGYFSLSFAHYTPIGIQKIRLQVVASRNIANIAEFEQFLSGLGERDNYPEQTFRFRLTNSNERSVLVMRAGWETPNIVYIPAYPAPDVH